MDIFVTDEFIHEVKSILKNNSHCDCESALINSIFTQSIEEIKLNGCKRLGGNPEKSPFLRKRIEGTSTGKSSGYRLYFWLMVMEENIYLLFIHPKTGKRSGSNLTTEKQNELVKTFISSRDNSTFIKVELKNNKIVYTSDDPQKMKAVF